MRRQLMEQARARLTAERERLAGELQQLDEERIEITTSLGELSNLPTHNADRADDGLEVQVVLQDTLGDELDQIEVALQRIDAGTYGTCDACGQEIAAERLAALPFVAQCIECAKNSEPGSF